ncbi:hypothetical protein QR680_001727 [Steinernema hermaphroditum]|uniref:G-protein coupled receptors family 1 profile domain-containing protein n=1 Tax=Steinernema hermaphroditum TaxID=289476 RepID=A0AA39LGR6_9BILA|nr:hypothetical protein QR680_001727 [Steinernema hermaphroditum]
MSSNLIEALCTPGVSVVSQWYSIVLLLFALCGLIGNLHTLLLTTRAKRHRLNRYAQALCIWDIAVLLTIISYKLIVTFWTKPFQLWSSTELLITVGFTPVNDIYITASTWLLTAITAERYLAVSRPFKERTRKKNSIKWICFLIATGAIAVNLPRSLVELYMSDCVQINTGRVFLSLNPLNQWLYIGLARVFPDLLFTCPMPPIISIYLTFRILQYRHKRLTRSMDSCYARKTSFADHVVEWMSSKTRFAGRLQPGFDNSLRRTKPDSFKSPLFLTLLNGKFIICNIMQIVTVFFRLTPAEMISDEALEICKEIGLMLIVLHSSTNWIIFFKYQSRSMLSRDCIPDYQIFNSHEKKRLTSMWSRIDVPTMGTELLLTLIEHNPLLIKSLIPYITDPNDIAREQLVVHERFRFVGSRIGHFINTIMTTMKKPNMTREDFVQIRAELRNVGMIHFMEKVKMNSQDWFLIKRYLVRQMMNHCECVVNSSKAQCSNAGTKLHNEQLLVANKFSSFLIHELKNGFVCETVRNSHQNINERDNSSSCTLAPNGYYMRNRHKISTTSYIMPTGQGSCLTSSLKTVNRMVCAVQEFVMGYNDTLITPPSSIFDSRSCSLKENDSVKTICENNSATVETHPNPPRTAPIAHDDIIFYV